MGTLIFLSLGSNLGDRFLHLSNALQQIEQRIGEITRTSSVFETPPYGFEADTNFLNMCLGVTTQLTPEEVLVETQQIEIALGRKEKSKHSTYSSRTIDLDIILYNSLIITLPELTIPHPRFHERRFVLEPLSEIAPDQVDPVSEKSIKTLHSECIDESPIAIYKFQF
ncbi:MAG: 2-amino-4-hydroxy-6-hydroxymethyldihydropteridine diphosphokinase [Crocinitomicaceae bacterium]|nr:2-amino-4-hydroxy-6-hydroxymethyldihydropteridine diphosphokinase [Crocinitomicaceae bacterium]